MGGWTLRGAFAAGAAFRHHLRREYRAGPVGNKQEACLRAAGAEGDLPANGRYD
jgi:hypothetical protein